MNRIRNLLSGRTRRLMVAITSLVLVVACAPPEPDGPSLLLVCADTVRADIFSHAGIEDELTPFLAQAQRYTNAMTTAPWTMPAVSSVFTGLYPVQHGGGSLEGPVSNLDEQTPLPLADGYLTLAEVLERNDFSTRAFVAHPWFKPGFGLDQGFQHIDYDGKNKPLVEKMLAWISDLPSSARYFAYLHLMETHELHRKGEEEIRTRFSEFSDEKRQFLEDHANPSVCRKINSVRCIKSQAYMASVLELRQSLADVLGRLESTGRLDDTIVVLFSDHGEEFREHTEQHRDMQTDPRGMYGVGHGQSQFQQLLHVPLVAWKPGSEGAGHDELVSLVDIFPTVLSWLEFDHTNDSLPGRLLPAGFTDSTADPDRVAYASHIAFGPETIAIVRGKQKAMYWPNEDRFLFFDLADDPGERTPLEDDALLFEFSTLAGDYLDMERERQAVPPELAKDQLGNLKSIGYLQGVENNTSPGGHKETESSDPDRPGTDTDEGKDDLNP